MWSAGKVLQNSPKFSDMTERDVFQLNTKYLTYVADLFFKNAQKFV